MKKRIVSGSKKICTNICLSPDSYQLLKLLSNVTELSQSSLIEVLLLTAVHQPELLAYTIEQAKGTTDNIYSVNNCKISSYSVIDINTPLASRVLVKWANEYRKCKVNIIKNGGVSGNALLRSVEKVDQKKQAKLFNAVDPNLEQTLEIANRLWGGNSSYAW